METQGWTAGFRHDPVCLETERLLPGNIRLLTKHDSIGRLTGQEILKNITGIEKKEYLCGRNDRLLSVNDNGKVRQYEYDRRGYPTRMKYADGTTEIRVPDNTGNLYETLNRSDRKYGKGGQLIKTARWDDVGNLVRKTDRHGATWCYEWNYAGMLSRVKRPDSGEITFRYDALGRRIEKRFNRAITQWVWDGNVPLHEWKEIHKSFRYQRQYEDAETGLYYNRFRYYFPEEEVSISQNLFQKVGIKFGFKKKFMIYNISQDKI